MTWLLVPVPVGKCAFWGVVTPAWLKEKVVRYVTKGLPPKQGLS